MSALSSHDLTGAGPVAQARALDAGTVTSVDLTEAVLAAIDRVEPSLNAVVERLTDRARAAALAADERRAAGATGPLLGVPIALKNDLDVAGHRTGLGSRAVARVADADGALVRRLVDLGAVPVATTTLPELAIYGFTESAAHGITRNPHDTGHTSGGSSGGSAALVAAGAIGVATASDGAGSIRIPAACCGLVGFKPTHGTVPGSGGWHGLSTQGAVVPTVADAASYLEAVGTFSASLTRAAADADPGRLRIGVATTPAAAGPPAPLDPAVSAALARAADVLAATGHEVREVEVPYGLASRTLMVRYLAGIRDAADGVDDPIALEPRTRGIVRLGRPIPHAAVVAAGRAGYRWGGRVHDQIGVDVLLTPVMRGTALPVGHFEGRGALGTVLGMNAFYPYTAQWNHAGTPAVSLPAGMQGTLPLAVQLIARRGDDARLMALAASLEAGLS